MNAQEFFYNNLSDPVRYSEDKTLLPSSGGFLPKEEVSSKPYILINNNDKIFTITVDIDREDSSTYWENIGFPIPSYILVSPTNGHAHYIYLFYPTKIDTPSSLKQLEILESFFKQFSHKVIIMQPQMSKNPLCTEGWNVKDNHKIYSLYELSLYVPKDFRVISKKDYAINRAKKFNNERIIHEGERNSALFGLGFNHAYNELKEYKLEKDLYKHTLKYIIGINNSRLDVPLEILEVNNIAKSIAKRVYIKRNEFSNRQREKAILSNKSQKENTTNKILLARKQCEEQGISITTKIIAKISGVSVRNINERYSKLLF